MMVGKWVRFNGCDEYHETALNDRYQEIRFVAIKCLDGDSLILADLDHETDSPPEDQKCKRCAKALNRER